VFLAGAGIRQTPAIAEATNRPVMTVTMPTDPDASPEVLEASGVKIACYAYQVMAVALGAVEKALTEIKTTGRIEHYAERAISREGYQKLTGAAEAVDIARRFNATRG
jgi:2-methylisocitrate lyase-like PEP mutase family enzyme